MKIFISADIEGTNGINSWSETELGHRDYNKFAEKMTKEVNAICKGVNAFYEDSEIYIKDGHETGRNINHEYLPNNTILNRGWSGHPYGMMDGIEESFDCSIFSGYHSPAGSKGNPLSHTMNFDIVEFRINDILASEFLINYYTSLYMCVPVALVSGDENLCKMVNNIDENIITVPTSIGMGNSTTSPHTDIMYYLLEQNTITALANLENLKKNLPEKFKMEIRFKSNYKAYRASFYPGAVMVNSTTVRFESTDYFEILKAYMFF